MCGFTGFTKASEIAETDKVLTSMMERIVHRGPDSEGRYIDDDIAMGFRRLSIIDITDSGDQPIFNEDGSLFDTEDPRYIAAWKASADRLLKAGVPFEINTGAMSKGYRSEPYPAKPIRDYIRSGGGHFILSSDSHRTDTLCYAFDRYEDEADITAPPAR